MQSNVFGFDSMGISNQTAISEFSPRLALPVWVPVQTNQMNGSPQYFLDNTDGQKFSDFYRVSSR